MARVNHKRVRQLLNEKRSKITDKQFFTSRILAGSYEDMAAAQSKRYHYNRRVRVNIYWDPMDPNGAMTNNRSITINAGNPCVTKIKGRQNRYVMVSGLFTHELGHVLYTDFLAKQTYLNHLCHHKWYPEPPELITTRDAANELEFWDYVKADSRNMKYACAVASYISNVLEDAYIESRLLSEFPGSLGYYLSAMRETQFEEMPTVAQLIEKEEDGSGHIFFTILQIMLSYALFGEIKYDGTPLTDERIQTVFKLIPKIDEAITTTSAKDRWKIVSHIIVRCWHYIQDYIELCKQTQDDSAASGTAANEDETIAGLLGAIAGASAAGDGSDTPVAGAVRASTPAANASARANTRAQAAKAASDKDESDTSAGNESKTSEEASANTQPQADADSAADSVSAPMNGGCSGTEKQETTDQEGGRIPYHQTDSVQAPSGGETEYDDAYKREMNERAASDIERMLEQMAEKAACKQLESERLKELNEVAQNIAYGDIHSGVNVVIHRIPEADEELEQQYYMICDPLLDISRQLQRSLVRQLKDQQRGGKQAGLVMGRRLDAHALCRNDGKAFYKNNLPNEIPKISVGLLLDESYSMNRCDRITYARAAAIIMYDFCHSLNIPIMVYGHSTKEYGSDVDLYSYAEFDDIDQNDRFRMMDISARNANRDGAALHFVAEQLSKRPEEIRILFLVSDGKPIASGYSGTAAEEDLRGIKQEYKRKGILFVAAAIGDDKANIERIYGDSFMDITDLNQLPAKLTAVIKRFLR